MSPDAKITIGERCNLGGMTVRCQDLVTIGDRVMTAVSLIQDFVFPPEKNGDFLQTFQNAAPVIIGNNVWISTQSTVLSGTDIGDDSVLAAGSVCHQLKAKEYSLIIGNPARRGLPIEQIMKLKKAL
jgi:acetyltransferase-like isoleucine patch superfamily enzyme